MAKAIKFVCPHCKKNLTESPEVFFCSKCSIYWPIRDGIPSFTKKDIYWNEIPKEEMQELLNIAKSKGWKTALYDTLKFNDRRDYNIIGDERRGDWKHLLPLNKDSVVLDFGCGWGAIAIALSQICGKVVAIDATWERVKFLSIRKEQQKIVNLYPIQGGGEIEFPFPDKYFDAITMIGVFEWLGLVKKDNPQEAQKIALRKIYNLLKKEGMLYIGIENRFGFNYLLGGKDHNGLRFLSLMPRFIANFISKKVKGEPYIAYQYSIWGYKKLLKEAGFSKIEFYAPLPQYRLPFFYIPFDNNNAWDYFFNNLFYLLETASPETKKSYGLQYKIAKICAKFVPLFKLTPLVKFVTPGFSIIARK